MGNASSMLTQYDIEDVQENCSYLCFASWTRALKDSSLPMSIPEFSLNSLSQRLIRMLGGLNFMDFVVFLSAFSPRANLQQKVEFIFEVYDLDGNEKVAFGDILEVLRDLTGSFMSDKQREQTLVHVLEKAGYGKDCNLTVGDFLKVLADLGVKMDVEVPVD